MEEDRAIADLGPDVTADTNDHVAKTPKRRFIGRKAADAKAAARAVANGENNTIEDSGAVQRMSLSVHHDLLLILIDN